MASLGTAPHFIKTAFLEVLRRFPEHWWQICVAIPAIGRENNIDNHCDIYNQIVEIDLQGCTRLYGQLHSFNDYPAVITANGTKMWYKGGKIHRGGDLPAVMEMGGSNFWYQNGQLHRNGDLPAVV